MATLACFVLLAEREAHLKSKESTLRFTYEELSREISELGLPMNGNLEGIIEGMEKSRYIRVQEDSFLLGKTRLLESCHILDEIFPRMPGLNLVAYIVERESFQPRRIAQKGKLNCVLLPEKCLTPKKNLLQDKMLLRLCIGPMKVISKSPIFVKVTY